MLRHLSEQGIGIGDQFELIARQPFGGPSEIRIGEQTHSLGIDLARAIQVERD
jgi:Fe2+ transport system protein FeoA